MQRDSVVVLGMSGNLSKVNPRRVLKIECHGFHWLLKDILEFTNVPEGHSGYLELNGDFVPPDQ